MLHFTLYVAGVESPRSTLARQRLDRLVARLDAEVAIDVVDVVDAPTVAERAGVIATPTLVRESTTPTRRVIGDLAALDVVTRALGLVPYLRDRDEGDGGSA